MANTSVATAPTTPPTIALVFELPLPEDDVGVVLPVGTAEVPEAPINVPGPISGLSTKGRCKETEKDGEESSYHQRTSL
jgi:hypothetical protein